jgi:hypothetical protein
MHAAMKSLVEFLRKPEWIAAIALLIQAAILFLQAVILRRHGATMEEHAGIAKAQAETAKLIGQALDQQGKVLDEQTKIMDQQFKFQRTIELKAERVQVFDALMQLHVSFKALFSTLSEVQLSHYTEAMQDRVRSGWRRMQEDLLPCTKAIHTSIHLTPKERDYFMGYVRDIADLTESSDIRKAIENVKACEAKYKDFAGKMFAAAKTPISS